MEFTLYNAEEKFNIFKPDLQDLQSKILSHVKNLDK